jgi:hypothetical protein
MTFDPQEKIAASMAGISGAGAATAWVADALPWVQFIAGVVAIVAGLFAIRYHYMKAAQLNDL